MGIIIRQSFTSTIISYIGVVIGTINILWLSPQFLRPDQLGLTRFLIESSVIFTSFSQLGIPHIIDKFLPHYKDEKEQHHGFLSFVLIYAFLGFLIFLVFFFLMKEPYVSYYQKRSPLLIDYFYFIVPLTFFSMYLNIIEAYGRGHARIVASTFVKEIFLKAANCFLIIMFGIGLITFDQMVGGLILSFGIGVVILLFYIKKLKVLFFVFPKKGISKSSLKEMSVFGLFIILGGLGSVLAAKIDILMLPGMTNLNLTGVYVIALFIGTVIEIPKRNVGQISTPIISKAFKENDLGKIKEIYKKSSVNLMIIGFLIFICIWANINDLFNIIPKSEIFKEGKYVVFFISLAKLIDLSIGVNGEIILNSKYYRMILYYVLILAVLTVGANFVFIPIYGITGAAIAMALAIFIFTLIKLWFVWNKFEIQPFTKKSFFIILVAGLCFMLSLLFPDEQKETIMSFLNIGAKCLVMSIAFLFLIYKLKISEEFNSIVSLVIKKLIKN